jgi:hypothetical protein
MTFLNTRTCHSFFTLFTTQYFYQINQQSSSKRTPTMIVRLTTPIKMLVFSVVALIASFPGETLASTSRLAQADECKDHSHFNCHHIAEDGDCDGRADKGEIIGDVFCPVSCGRCGVDSDEIYTDQTCYTFGKQEIHTKFANSNPDQEDWVGIYPEDANPNELGSPIAWYWLCGSKKDKCKTGVGAVTFPWLPPGKYRALLSRHHSTKVHRAPYTSYAQSEVFEVVRGNTCAARRRTEDGNKKSLRGSQKWLP